MSVSFVAYIDESGDEGFSFGKGSSDWFVLSAVITKKANDLSTVKLIDRVRRLLSKPEKKPFHFRDLKHEQRVPFIAEIAKADLRTISIFIYKRLLRETEKFRKRYCLYFYAVRYLLERVSWYCRDHHSIHTDGDGTAQIIFSNRSGMSYEEMKNYLLVLKSQAGPLGVTIDWDAIKPEQITSYSSGQQMGLQIADAVASSFFYAVQPSGYGYTEDRYAHLLRTVVYQHRGVHLGYGIKLWPKETEDWAKSQPTMGWLREYQ